MLATVIILTATSIALADPQGRRDPPSKDQLAAITERGRLLAGYDAGRLARHGRRPGQDAEGGQRRPLHRPEDGERAGWSPSGGSTRGGTSS